MRFFTGQFNPAIGDLQGNRGKILTLYKKGQTAGASLVITPELALTGYPPEDLLLRKGFVEAVTRTIGSILPEITDTALLLCTPFFENGKLYNSALFIRNGKIIKAFHKKNLPTYGVFDEARYFNAGSGDLTLDFEGVKLGVAICRDAWEESIHSELKLKKADVILSPNASPYKAGKLTDRRTVIETCVSHTGAPLLYINMVGAQDEMVFDGRTFTLNPEDDALSNMHAMYKEENRIVELGKEKNGWRFIHGERTTQPSCREEKNFHAILLAVKDYFKKSGNMERAVIGLSGGVDSALVAALAVQALGSENVTLIAMPSPYSSENSLKDAEELSFNLKVKLLTHPIEEILTATHKTLNNIVKENTHSHVEQNIQARIRAQILMAYANAENALLLTTGNKSEIAVGYCTLYGDMCGAFNPIKDLYKTDVYNICRWLNKQEELPKIPENILIKEPSAELAPEQKDSDTLPPYEVLDLILQKFIEEDLSVREIIASGFEEGTVKQVEKLLSISEFKRAQAAPGPKLTDTAFGRDWRMPLAGKKVY